MNDIEIEYSNIEFNSPSYKFTETLAKKAARKIIESINENKDPLYKIFSMKDAIAQAKNANKYANEIKDKFKHLIIVGMGGAILNPESVISLLASNNSKTKIHFLHNTDPDFLGNLLAEIELKDSAILAISNSGKTLETISLVGVMISEYQKRGITDLSKYFYFITNVRDGSLRNIAKKINATIIEHSCGISGRYSGFTNVVTLAAQVADINIEEYLSGAQLILNDFIDNLNNNVISSASSVYSANKPISVNIAYTQKFNIFLEWYSQIIAESLGKDGSGITPIRGLGPNDQHSMLQLYLDGPRDKFYTFFSVKNSFYDFDTASMNELDYVSEKKLHDINITNFSATINALSNKKLPIRTIRLNKISAKTIGSLIMHSMLETISLGHMMQVNPFNQPGIEAIKIETKRIIGKTN